MLEDWLALAQTSIKTGGTVTFIHRADRQKELTAGFSGGAWRVTVYPLWPKGRERGAKRVIVHARQGDGMAPMMVPGLVLHDADGRYTNMANAVLRDCAPIDLQDLARGEGTSLS